ncbi:hypothetical protein Tco_1213578 [Tanacetum coccineum]
MRYTQVLSRPHQWQVDMENLSRMDPTPHPMITDPPTTDSALLKVFPDISSTPQIIKHCKEDLGYMWRCSCKDQPMSLMPKRLSRKHEPSTSIVDPPGYVAHTHLHRPALSSPSNPCPQPTAQSPT